MGDVRIRHCTLRLIRRGGWSWGPEPGDLLNLAREVLPGLLADELGRFVDSPLDLHVRQPVRLRLPLRPEPDSAAGGARTNAVRTALTQAFRPRLREALMRLGDPSATQKPLMERGPAPESSHLVTPPEHPKPSRASLAAMLARWRDQGHLTSLLARIPDPLLARWEQYLLSRASGAFPSTQPGENVEPRARPSLATRFEALLVTAQGMRNPSLSPYGKRILLLTAALVRPAERPQASILKHLLDHLVPEACTSLPEKPAAATTPSASSQAEPTNERPTAPDDLRGHRQLSAAQVLEPCTRPLHIESDWRERVPSALPFLVLGVLSRLGWVEALTGCIEAADGEPEAKCLATALAYKCLDPPRRGWLREPSCNQAAAVFAGLREPLAENRLIRFAEQAGDVLAALDVWLARRMASERATDQALLLHRPESGENSHWLLLDPDGVLPVGWSDVANDLIDRLEFFGSTPVWVTAAAATSSLLGDLDRRDRCFLTSVPPLRGEHWRPLGGRAPTWTNDLDRPAAVLTAARSGVAEMETHADRLHEALIVQRHSWVTRSFPELERTLSLATGAALGLISRTLWQRREICTPLLAFQRFGDLEAEVTFGRDRIQVRLPLGSRSSDLREHGFLADIRNTVWLGGRPVEFQTW